ncbi:sulfite exporter TauE/SafE family protein [Alloalcanivorax gelatiniphagus]|uniref:Probable membrane transporter protein n=1 Tax=Alloalcanivorax gelatiniphagus TaxID=1194167 RepID=A0ABY2XNN0_9GAMM|nr:sulfite exporter TauE/SafE family protein [Alloalcanivorax gelatiniphagus]TMW14079.1 sulfite exporter TauE/SafE family protein [Alloalcanivorax gelatiniphagus]
MSTLVLPSLATFAALCLTFGTAGTVKGLTGFGMPLVGIPLTILLLDVPPTTVMGWMLAPIFITNLAQLISSRHRAAVVVGLWPLFAGLLLAMLASVPLLARLHQDQLSLLVGVLVLLVTLSQFMRPWRVAPAWRRAFLFTAGVVSGAVGGATSFFGFPAVHALLAVDLDKTGFIFSVSLMFLVGGVVIAAALGGYGLIGGADLVISALVVAPALAGLWLGQRLRGRLSLLAFQRLVRVVLLLVGCSMIYKGL